MDVGRLLDVHEVQPDLLIHQLGNLVKGFHLLLLPIPYIAVQQGINGVHLMLEVGDKGAGIVQAPKSTCN